ncbi:MAG TPA: hypothetical protein VFX41_00745 [Actinomycetales bacterium]|jgi:hypothetical protein|nr:hypothetical protein [Actinomycetales bacterium]
MAQNDAVDELVALDRHALDTMEQGQEFVGADYYALAFLGLIIPVALLVWGWL